MKKTVQQHFNGLPEGEFKDWVLSNVDERFLDKETYTLNFALTFGVLCPKSGDFKKIEQFINNNK